MIKKWEYTETQGDWSVRGSYDEPDNIQFLHKGEIFHSITVPGYKIFNYAAHLNDYIPQLEEELKNRQAKEERR